ncbi:hypothetical protein BDN70DRAFT_459086 [Pholiota conissans]|uniref:Uncharacterized protein n=1 Tax=Pholiota conissans TaxID=109636 RepID=A0A9P5ZE67_9AGAR|nr:hypothetical protein BDN70DRAFT_459086 [Pholiota conissans]
MFPTPPTSHPSSSPSTRPIDDDDDDPDARDAHLVFHPTRQPSRAAPDPTSLSLPASVSASASSSRSVTPSYLPATSISSPVTPSATPSPAMSPGAPPLIKSKSHASAAGYTNYPHQNVNASPSAGQPWLLRPVARAPSAESLLRFSPGATASRTPLAPEIAPVHLETYPHSGPHFPPPPSPSLSPPMQNLTLQNHSPHQSPTIAARVPSNLAHPLPRSTHTSPPPLRKQHSAYTLGGGAEAGRGHGYYNHGARGTPPLQELPPIHAQITANSNRKASTSVSTSSSASTYTSSTPTSPTGMATSPTTTNTSYTAHTTSSISTSPPEELLSSPTSPADNKALPPLPSSSRFPPHSHGPRKAVSHNNMRTVRTRARPATTEGVVGNRGIGVGTGGGAGKGGLVGVAGQGERGGFNAGGEREWEKRMGKGREREREDVTPWEYQSPSELTSANTGAGAQSQRSRASSVVGATGSMEEVIPWEGKDGQEIEKMRDEEIDAEDRDYGVSRPMEFTRGRPGRASNAASTISAGSAASNSTGTSAALSVRSRSSSALAATGPIEEVTPWEVQATPESGTRARGGSGAGAQSVRSRASSTALSATGPVEEVTPWEVQTLVEENEQEFNAITTTSSGSSGKVPTSTKSANSATRQRPPHRTKERSDSHSTTAPSMRSRASSAAVGSSSYALGAGAGGSVATGPVEEVTPWEVQVPTSANEEGESGQAPRTSIDAYGVPRALEVDAAPFTPLPTTPGGAVSVRSDVLATGTGAVEEVTPWEVQAGPGETVYGVSREVRVPGVEQERERERSRSILSFHSSGSGGYGVPKTAGSTSMANGSAYNNNTTGNNNGDNKSVRSGRSRASSAVHSPGGVGTTSTGSVEEVTPWEMYPAPPALHSPPPPLPTQGPMGHSTRNHEQEGEKKRKWGRKVPRSSTPAPPSSSGTGTVAPSIAATTSTDSSDANYARSVKSTHTHKSTGAVEDVTPWEVQELPSSPPLPPSVVTRPPLPPRAATLESSFSYHATASAQAITATRSNPIHGNGEFAPARSSAPRRTSAATTSTTGSAPSIGLARPHLPAAVAEEVTPWEFAGALPVQVERITASGGPGHAPLGVTVEVHLPGENEEGQGSAHRNMGEGQELEVPHGWGEGSTPNTATFSTSSGHHSGSGYGPPPSSATSHASYVSTVPSYVSNASTTTGASRSVARGSMTLEQLSEVMPWELHPVPTKVGSEMSAEEKAAKDRGNRRVSGLYFPISLSFFFFLTRVYVIICVGRRLPSVGPCG